MWQPIEENTQCEFCQNKINIWNFLDAAYIICLSDRPDRYEIALAELHKTGLCQVSSFYRAKRSSDGFVAGCWDSHVQIAKHALDLHQNTVLALEDDFEMDKSRSIHEIVEQIKSALQYLPKEKWTRLSLGHISWFKMHYAPGVDRTSSILTHAQIWSPRGLEWMAKNSYDITPDLYKKMNIMVDGYISFHLPFSYAVKPMIAFQKDAISDRQPGDTLIQESAMQATETWVPLAWLSCIFVVIVVLMGILILFFKIRFAFSLLFVTILFVVPFSIVWILILTDTM
jgi:GR25 family glycosyltransferase involved in LPS biosynthesis